MAQAHYQHQNLSSLTTLAYDWLRFCLKVYVTTPGTNLAHDHLDDLMHCHQYLLCYQPHELKHHAAHWLYLELLLAHLMKWFVGLIHNPTILGLNKIIIDYALAMSFSARLKTGLFFVDSSSLKR